MPDRPLRIGGRDLPSPVQREWGLPAGDLARRCAAANATVRDLLHAWDLEVEESVPVGGGAHAVVLPVRRGDEALMLRVPVGAVEEDEVAAAAAALRLWDGQGAARLAAHDPKTSAMLVERLDPMRTLAEVALPGAGVIAGRLLRRLAIPAPEHVPARSTRDVAAACSASVPVEGENLLIDARVADHVSRVAVSLAEDEPPRRLVHADLHDGNVLAGRREPWLAVDPKVRIGSPEIAVAEFLWTRIDQVADVDGIRAVLDTVVKAAGLDAERARAWAMVRALDYLRWGLEHGLTIDPPRCARLIRAVA